MISFSRGFSLLVRGLPWLLCLLIAACAGNMRGPSRIEGQEIRSFQIEARFSLKVPASLPHSEALQGGSGRLLWRHEQTSDHMVFYSPLGHGLAELNSNASGASLKLASGEERQATDPVKLLQGILAYPLPLAELPGWLLGRPRHPAELQRDAYGRPQQLNENGWVIEYAYEDVTSTLPSRLNIRREGEIELRLRIEEWQINL